MRMHSIVAVGLVVFLTVVSSWASACDLSCSLQRIGKDCDDSAAAGVNSPRTATGASHCEHASQTASRSSNSSADEMADMPGMTTSHDDAAQIELASQAMAGTQPCSRSSVSATAAAETNRYEFK